VHAHTDADCGAVCDVGDSNGYSDYFQEYADDDADVESVHVQAESSKASSVNQENAAPVVRVDVQNADTVKATAAVPAAELSVLSCATTPAAVPATTASPLAAVAATSTVAAPPATAAVAATSTVAAVAAAAAVAASATAHDFKQPKRPHAAAQVAQLTAQHAAEIAALKTAHAAEMTAVLTRVRTHISAVVGHPATWHEYRKSHDSELELDLRQQQCSRLMQLQIMSDDMLALKQQVQQE
jgi:hypothetical protein